MDIMYENIFLKLIHLLFICVGLPTAWLALSNYSSFEATHFAYPDSEGEQVETGVVYNNNNVFLQLFFGVLLPISLRNHIISRRPGNSASNCNP